MANKYCNLNGYNKVSDEYSLITTGFDGVDADVKALQTEVGEIVKAEEGTFTPSLVGSTVAGDNTYTFKYGKYIKIGNLVHFDLNISLGTKDIDMAGNLTIVGLPFISLNETYYKNAISISSINKVAYGEYKQITGGINQNANRILLYKIKGDITSTVAPFSSNDISDTFSISISGTYKIG